MNAAVPGAAAIATAGGPAAMNRPETGRLAPGMAADVIVVDLDAIHAAPVDDPAAALVCSNRRDLRPCADAGRRRDPRRCAGGGRRRRRRCRHDRRWRCTPRGDQGRGVAGRPAGVDAGRPCGAIRTHDDLDTPEDVVQKIVFTASRPNIAAVWVAAQRCDRGRRAARA